jgi:hypothetical protein
MRDEVCGIGKKPLTDLSSRSIARQMSLLKEQFLQQQATVRGLGNPQRMRVPLWEKLVRTGETAYAVAQRYGCTSGDPAGWCFDRFGMTRTRLPDGRIVCVGGEHEDYYDPDFFIYNDVVVIHPDRAVEIYGYALSVFPPTDFHTASLIGDAIYVIGGLGYRGERGRPTTPVYRLDLRTMAIHPVLASGDDPGCVFHHRAELGADPSSIRIAGGQVSAINDGTEVQRDHMGVFCFDVVKEQWSPDEGFVPTLPVEAKQFAFPGWRMEADKKAQQLRDSLARAAPPDHPLFCGDFWPAAVEEHWPRRAVLIMLDGSGRWALTDSPDYTGRQKSKSLGTILFASYEELHRALLAGNDSQS